MTDTTPPQTGGPGGPAIEDYLLEDRTFPPTEAFRATALVAGTSNIWLAALGATRARVGSGQPFYAAVGFGRIAVGRYWTSPRLP